MAKGESSAPSTQAAPPVLVAGADTSRRVEVLGHLAGTMPEGTRFEEAAALWEVLARAPASRMVVLSGDFDELPAEKLLQMLGHRYPDLPVVSLDTPLAARA
jgi:hypothetical protein